MLRLSPSGVNHRTNEITTWRQYGHRWRRKRKRDRMELLIQVDNYNREEINAKLSTSSFLKHRQSSLQDSACGRLKAVVLWSTISGSGSGISTGVSLGSGSFW